MLSKGSRTFTWDALGRLGGLTLNGGATTAFYTYNGDGVRVGKTVDGTTTTYLQDLAAGLPVVLVETTSGTPTRYVYGADLLAQLDSADVSAYYHADGLGSTRAMSDSAGQQTATYDAFSAVRTQTGRAGNSFTFTGEQVILKPGWCS